MNQPARLQAPLSNDVRPRDDSPFNIDLADKIARIRGPEHLACDCSGSSTVIFRECVIWLAVAALLWIGGLFVVMA